MLELQASEPYVRGLLWETLVVTRVENAPEPAGDNWVLRLWCAAERADELAPIFDRIVASLRIHSASS